MLCMQASTRSRASPGGFVRVHKTMPTNAMPASAAVAAGPVAAAGAGRYTHIHIWGGTSERSESGEVEARTPAAGLCGAIISRANFSFTGLLAKKIS